MELLGSQSFDLWWSVEGQDACYRQPVDAVVELVNRSTGHIAAGGVGDDEHVEVPQPLLPRWITCSRRRDRPGQLTTTKNTPTGPKSAQTISQSRVVVTPAGHEPGERDSKAQPHRHRDHHEHDHRSLL